ncbi:PAS/PAC sensor signal transduction histidine kinase [Nitrosomonas sp. Is79A3]|uniref:ATP-binding protein n=1 Tax=Nitrosomonas sp. (strain Is79A3) TaxID=261292 RepID=UPI000215D3EB
MDNEHRRKDDDISHSKLELLVELQIHQTELEMQNLELKEAQQQLEESRNHYADLYDYAPVGYLTVDQTGDIRSINLTGASLLGKERALLIGRQFIACFSYIDHQAFFHYLHDIFNNPNKVTLDLKIGNTQNQFRFIHLESIADYDNNLCRMILSDISQLREAIDGNRELLNENRRLMKELFRIQEKERRTLAYELHDELGQWITAIRAENEVILSHAEKNANIAASAQAIKDCTQRMHEVIHNMLHQLRPALMDALGLPNALLELRKQWCSHHQHIVLELQLQGELTMFDEQLNIAVFRLVQESLNNICNHSEANWAQISLVREAIENSPVDYLYLNIEDNGKGYDVNQQYTGLGLLGMRERVIAMNGTLSVRSACNEGTEINIRLPIENSNDDKTNLHSVD